MKQKQDNYYFFLLYLNLQDDNHNGMMFRNSLNFISASLTETALLLVLLHCHYVKIHIYIHCCLLHFTETNKL